MKRRSFINQTILAGLSSAALSGMPAVRPPTGITRRKRKPPKKLQLKGAYYRHHPIDFTGERWSPGDAGWGKMTMWKRRREKPSSFPCTMKTSA